MFHLNLFSYACLALSTAFTTFNFLLFFSSLFFLDRLSKGEINHIQTKKQIIRVQSTKDSENLKAIKNFPRIKGGANTKNKIDAKLKI